MRARSVLGTFFYSKEDPEEWLKHLKDSGCDYVVGQCEICPTTQKPHIQFFAHAKNPCRWPYLKQFKCHYESAQHPEEARLYCMKDKTRFDGPWEFGIFNKNGRPKLTCKEKLEMPIKELIEQDYIQPLQVKKMIEAQQIYTLITKKAVPRERDQDKKIGCWIYGEPRTGKSTQARENHPYIKMANKWWDGYLGEEEVLLEDVEPTMESWLGYFLKIWTDNWEFRSEIKGGSILIGPFSRFWITSNYPPEEIFKDEKILAAILARFEIIHKI